jgi:hypothetical protein
MEFFKLTFVQGSFQAQKNLSQLHMTSAIFVLALQALDVFFAGVSKSVAYFVILSDHLLPPEDLFLALEKATKFLTFLCQFFHFQNVRLLKKSQCYIYDD